MLEVILQYGVLGVFLLLFVTGIVVPGHVADEWGRTRLLPRPAVRHQDLPEQDQRYSDPAFVAAMREFDEYDRLLGIPVESRPVVPVGVLPLKSEWW